MHYLAYCNIQHEFKPFSKEYSFLPLCWRGAYCVQRVISIKDGLVAVLLSYKRNLITTENIIIFRHYGFLQFGARIQYVFLLHLNFDESWSPDVFFVTLKILTSHRWLPDVFFLFLEPQVSQIFIHVNRSVCAEISVFCTRIAIWKNLFSNKTL